MDDAEPSAEQPQPDDPFRTLPAVYQQVMSPTGQAAQEIDLARGEQRPNGVAPGSRRIPADDATYERALEATGFGAMGAQPDHGLPGGNVSRPTSSSRPTAEITEQGQRGRDVSGIGSHEPSGDRGVQTGRRMSRVGHEVFSSPASRERLSADPPVFPHAGVQQQMRGSDAASAVLLPSPLPSPTSQAVAAPESSQGFNFVQQGAAAMKWVAKLGEFVQRRAAYVTQSRPGEHTTVVQETVWSPTASQVAATETEPLFDRSQVRRLREMAAGAPQLYGAVSRSAGGGSDSSASYTREQLEQEVRKQVERAMESQRSVVDENQQLRMELERLRKEVATTATSAVVEPVRDPLGGRGSSVGRGGDDGSRFESNPAGLSGHDREQGGEMFQGARDNVPGGNPGGPRGQGGEEQRAVSFNPQVISAGNSLGPLGVGHGPSDLGPQHVHGNVLGGNPVGPRGHGEVQGGVGLLGLRGVLRGNPPGLSGHDREQGGVQRSRSQSPPRANLAEWIGQYGSSEGQVLDHPPGLQRAARQEGVRGGPGSGGLDRMNGVFGSNPAGLSGHDREQGGRYNEYAQGISSGPFFPYAQGISSGTNVQPQNGAGSGVEVQNPKSKDNSNDPMEALAQGIAQLQTAMAMQLGMSASKPEAIRPGTSAAELPKLGEADEMAAINVGDWLHGLSGPMGDLTDGSAQWWSQVLASLDSYYSDYVGASAVKRLQLRADDYAGPMLKESRWLRVDKRAASMLLQAVPEAIRTEVLANRLHSTLAILARIMTIYRPGSAVERQQVLKALEAPGQATTAMELVECLRKWARWLKRAQDLGLQVPDPSILLKGLDQSARSLLEKNHEVMFRANMLRYSLELDATPTMPSVVKYHTHLLGEFEQLAYRGRTRNSTTTTPTIKAMGSGVGDTGDRSPQKGQQSPSTSTTTPKPCKFFVSESGCQRANCKFSHEWSNIPREERGDRCKNCGGKGHMRKNCPVRGAGDLARRDDGKGAQPRVRNLGKGAEAKRDDGAAPLTAAATSSSSSPPTASSSSGSASMGASTDTAASAPAPTPGEGGTAAKDMDDFLRNATQVLKMMTEQSASRPSPSMKMLKKVIKDYEGRMALVDSGATHPLRKASSMEWTKAEEVDVVVAGDGVKRMRQNDTGTLLMEPEATKAQTILPVGSLVGVLGYELVWTKKKCVLRSPEGKELVLKVKSGCPEVNEATALELISQIEQEKINQLRQKTEETKQAMVRAREVQMDPCWQKSMREYVANGKFEDGYRATASAPWATEEIREDLARIVVDLPSSESEAWALMQQLGFNRRMRKRLMSKDWVVKLCSGKRSPADKLFKAVENNGTVVLDIDVQRLAHLDLLKSGSGVMMMLLWGAATGRVAGVLCGLPRNCAVEHTLRALVLYEVATAGRSAMCAEVDVPLDGVAFSLWASSEAEEDGSSLAWWFKWFRRWIAETHLDLYHFDQGGLGHPQRRPTTMATNLDVAELSGVKDARSEAERGGGSWSSWALVMMRVLVRGLKRWKQRPGWYPRLVRTLRAADRRAWERHLANDHVPYRADCLQCIHNATGRPHRKCLHRDCYVLSADTLGPVRVAGTKGERHAVVFTYQFPKQKLVPEDAPVSEEELDGWTLDAKVTEGGDRELDLQPDYDDLHDYEPDEGPDVELSVEELEELRRVQSERPEGAWDEDADEDLGLCAARAAKKKEVSDDWWEFREGTGVLIRHHMTPRNTLFRPTSWNGCPIPPGKLDYTRVTEVKYISGGVETETSDWHGPQSGARSLDRVWTGRSTFRISAAEILEDEAELKRDEETWEKLIGDLTKPVEMDTIYMVYPVRARRGGDVMLAVQEAVLRLKLMGMPVARLHSDRGSEFASKGLRKWLLDHDIYHTRSEALVPQTNGAAERGVRWFKTMAKVLLAEAKVGMKFWTLAMQHAANRRIYERLGLTKPKLLTFGAKVMIRRKVFGNNKKYDLTDRWEEGTYLGLSDTIKGGAIVLRASGVLTETLNLKTGVVDPHMLLAEPEDDGGGVGDVFPGEVPVVDLPEPDHRLSGKQSPPELRALRTHEANEKVEKRGPTGWTMRSLVQDQEARARYYYNMGKFDETRCAEVLRDVYLGVKSRRKTRGDNTSALVLGGYVHGGLKGVTRATIKRPWLTKYLNMVLRQKTLETTTREPTWATLVVFKAAEIPPHRDLRNQPGLPNFVMEMGGHDVQGLWLSDAHEAREGDGTAGAGMQKELPDGSVAQGRVVDIKGKVAVFDPKKFHSYVDQEDDNRWIVAGFTPLLAETIPPNSIAFLNRCGFPFEGTGIQVHDVEGEELEMASEDDSDLSGPEAPDEEELEHKARVLRCKLEGEATSSTTTCSPYLRALQCAFEECAREIGCLQEKGWKRLMKVSPGEAMDVEVEELLKALTGPLEVVHNVSLPEVKKYAHLWKEAIMKEVAALVDSGTVKRLSPEQTRELKKAGLVILPGKAVFTVKPPSDPQGEQKYRRKCRVVVCGNFLPSQGQNVYASGTSADTLRIALALAVKMGWRIASTDVANAFTLAPMPQELMYALTPPTIVSLAGAAAPGET